MDHPVTFHNICIKKKLLNLWGLNSVQEYGKTLFLKSEETSQKLKQTNEKQYDKQNNEIQSFSKFWSPMNYIFG